MDYQLPCSLADGISTAFDGPTDLASFLCRIAGPCCGAEKDDEQALAVHAVCGSAAVVVYACSLFIARD